MCSNFNGCFDAIEKNAKKAKKKKKRLRLLSAYLKIQRIVLNSISAKLYKELSIEVRSAKMFALLFDKIIIKNKLFYIIF